MGEDYDQLQVFLKHIESPFVQSNLAIRESLMHIIPFLTFGDPRHMNVLLQHFAPYLDFDKYVRQSNYRSLPIYNLFVADVYTH